MTCVFGLAAERLIRLSLGFTAEHRSVLSREQRRMSNQSAASPCGTNGLKFTFASTDRKMISDEKTYRRKKREPSAAEILQRQPPFDLEAEMGVLGSILLLPEVCDDIASLRADDFYDDANRKIYENLREMHDSGDKIDITLLVSRLRTAGDYEKIGGAAYLARLSGSVPNAAHAVYYAGIVSRKSGLSKAD